MEVVGTDEFTEWYGALSDADESAVYRVVSLLETKGVSLDHPYSSKINGSKHSGMRELRVQSGGRPLRVFYIFDAVRDAVLLIGGDKTGSDRFYEEMVPAADKIYDQYLEERRPIIDAAKKAAEDAKKK